ncbi:hypothetical protein Pla52o_14810 [Novipirellula galeiformis]|uniref:Carboxypeptidase regulatory-like domain-containing protein n=1 Tax=Novipirellula galeiformis TaxID=2528004 RepID=A0A5C6CJZ2_9BACT|nr:carboxypeptidase regulatory-like domain-containing protein [Novipirellula galeiformis]TWU25183.1 hypothetical protein Pla52o_14810 [Novipirellula galeiformis]
MNSPKTLSILCAVVAAFVVGCGGRSDQPDLGLVTGLVTVDGAPAESLLVTFIPENGRPSTGVTNAQGQYELEYIGDSKGAKLGHHLVRITTLDIGEPNRPTRELISSKYNAQSELTAEVKAEDNKIDFAL